MVRQIPVSNPAATTSTSEASDLGRWLTRELRPKGAPMSSPPPAAPVVVDERAALAGWLTKDLRPKHSLRPSAAPEPEAAPLPPAAAAPPAVEPVRGAGAPAAVSPSIAPAGTDSLAPQLVPPAEPAPNVAPAALDDDDLSVLPGRRRSRTASGRKRYAFALLGLLLLGGALVVGFGAPGGAEADAAASVASPTDVTAALPPPPPSAEEVLPVLEPAKAPVQRTSKTPAASDEVDPDDPYSLGGPSVRRYADVPSPTLSRLAREQRRLARERDEAIRKEKEKAAPAKR